MVVEQKNWQDDGRAMKFNQKFTQKRAGALLCGLKGLIHGGAVGSLKCAANLNLAFSGPCFFVPSTFTAILSMKQLLTFLLFCVVCLELRAQSSILLPAVGGNIPSQTAQRIGITDIDIHWNAPGVKGREGKIWGTNVVHYGFQNLGFGTAKESPWRAGANECTTIAFSTDVRVEGKSLAAGKYGFFIAVYPDSCTLIFSKNNTAWGSFFYKPEEEALRVTVRQQKDQANSREWLNYEFTNQTENSATISLVWEHWRIPFRVSVDVQQLVLASMREEMQTKAGFMYENLLAAAQFCYDQNVNLEEGLKWADDAINSFAGVKSFTTYALKAQILEKLGRKAEAAAELKQGMALAGVLELHGYGRQLITNKKPAEALEVFLANYKKNGDVWPVHVGLMRGYSATGDLKKALEHANIALKQAPDDVNKRNLENAVKTLSEGKAIAQ